ncbi:hypothetical protein [Pseudomonas sp. NS1(2017)]|uniref:hypothetical protein n=1 Tax=Pseudomonas sp. NS1(2017) TaxID=2025658 RepID=UPI0012FDF390|nr:hypothetical protein [Pseudomonas sp. NS1(2017)]
MSDLLSITMANIEDALLEAGAFPAIDYTHLDLLSAAGPFVLSMFSRESGNPITLTTT